MRVGYRRVSGISQSLERQSLDDCEKIFEDKMSGKDRSRPGLEDCMNFLREGDVLVCHSADRLARSLKDLLSILDDLTSRGVTVSFVKEGMTFDPEASDPYQKCMLQVMGAFAEMEREIILARQAEGIALAVEKGGVFKGRKPALDPDEVRHIRRRHADGVGLGRLVADYGVAKITVQNAIKGVGVYSGPLYC